MSQVLTILTWTAFEYLVLKGWSLIAPHSFTAFFAKVFYVEESPKTP